jgi:hypothetical protein
MELDELALGVTAGTVTEVIAHLLLLSPPGPSSMLART